MNRALDGISYDGTCGKSDAFLVNGGGCDTMEAGCAGITHHGEKVGQTGASH